MLVLLLRNQTGARFGPVEGLLLFLFLFLWFSCWDVRHQKNSLAAEVSHQPLFHRLQVIQRRPCSSSGGGRAERGSCWWPCVQHQGVTVRSHVMSPCDVTAGSSSVCLDQMKLFQTISSVFFIIGLNLSLYQSRTADQPHQSQNAVLCLHISIVTEKISC